MADEDFTFTEGIDPTSTFPGAYATVLLQLVREAVPNPYRGMLIYSATTPAVTGDYAWHKRCIWIKTDDWTFYFYDDDAGSWESLFSAIPADAITTAMVQDGAITLAKLAVGAGTAGQIIRINAGATAFEFVNVTDAIAAGALNPNKLTPGTNGQILWTTGGAAAWASLTTILGSVAAGTFPVTTLQSPGASSLGKFLFANAATGAISWEAFDLNFAQAAGSVNPDMLAPGTNGQLLVTKSGVPQWGSAADLPAVSVPVSKLVAGANGTILKVVLGVPTWTTGGSAINSGYAAVTLGTPRVYTHSLGAMPSSVQWRLKCVDAAGDANYALDDEIPVESVYEGSGGGAFFAVKNTVNESTLTPCSVNSDTTIHPTTGAVANALDMTKWESICYIIP